MTADAMSGAQRPAYPPRPPRAAREVALETLAVSAARHIPGTDFASITVRRDDTLRTVAATDPLAERADGMQYELHEGPCYAAVTDERFVLVNDMAAAADLPRYGPGAVEVGIGAQAGIQLIHDRDISGLNLYARTPGSFDRSTVHFAELFATQAASLLGSATQVEQLSEAVQARTDIGVAVGMLIERYGIDRDQAFHYLVGVSNQRNVKLRLVAQQIVDGIFAESRPCTNAARRDNRSN